MTSNGDAPQWRLRTTYYDYSDETEIYRFTFVFSRGKLTRVRHVSLASGETLPQVVEALRELTVTLASGRKSDPAPDNN